MPRFLVYACCVGGFLVLLFMYVKALNKMSASPDPEKSNIFRRRCVCVPFSLCLPLCVAVLEYKSKLQYHRFCYAALSGTVGAQSVLFAKCFAELLMATIRGAGVLFAHWQT